jgi:hypothetical protein
MSLSAGRLDGLLESAVLGCLGLPGLSPGRDGIKRRELRCVSAGRARARANLARVCTYRAFVHVHLRLRWLLSVLVSSGLVCLMPRARLHVKGPQTLVRRDDETSTQRGRLGRAVMVDARRRLEWLYGVQVRGLWLWLVVILGGIAPGVAGR